MDAQETSSAMEELTENTAGTAPVVNEETETTAMPTSKTEVINRLKEMAQDAENVSKTEMDQLKQIFYKIHRNEVAEARAKFIEEGGEPESFLPAPNVEEDSFKAVMNEIKQARARIQAEQEQQKAENLQKKLEILDRIKAMAATPEEANQVYNEFKELQAQWKEIKNVPAEKASELWKNYQLYVEQFYDLLKLNSEFREYDFKKNLEIKTRLCETAERLAEEEDVVAAFQQLQALHMEFKETGPVAKELREEIWMRFKNASTLVNKRHQQHFEAIKAQEEENLRKKEALCEQVENTVTDDLKTFADWDERTKSILDAQATWKTIGFAPQKMNVKIFERFRMACDKFFEQKTAFYKKVKEELNENLRRKKAICEQAETLRESTEWKSTSDTLIQLQKEWKTIGAVPKKYSEALWKRFIGACDYFFEQKGKVISSQRTEENENLEKKRGVIAKLQALAVEEEDNVSDTVRELMKEWNGIGHVPFREKDKLYDTYRQEVDRLYKGMNQSSARRRLNNFKSNLKTVVEKEGNSLTRERDRMARAYDNLKNEIQTYETNLCFLSSSSKKGNSLVSELNKKVEKLKDELALLKEKIKAVDAEIRQAQ